MTTITPKQAEDLKEALIEALDYASRAQGKISAIMRECPDATVRDEVAKAGLPQSRVVLALTEALHCAVLGVQIAEDNAPPTQATTKQSATRKRR